ncbi:MAG: putative 2-dehydropantoate 2-reductase [Planctomycetota bacterium]
MMPPRTYAILGTGALGGYYGGMLVRAGLETHFLLRSDFDHVREHGLIIDSVRGDFALSVDQINAYGEPSKLPACDVAVVCLKTTQSDRLPELLAHCVKPNGVVLVLQNGLHPEADAAAIVGDDRVLGGLCFLCSNKIGPGHIQHLDYGHIHMGVYQPETSDSPATRHFPGIVEDFSAAGIETIAVDDLRLSRWKKLVWNIPYNGLSVVLNQTTDVMMGDPHTRRRIEAIMHEVQAAALAVDGKVIEDAFIQKMLDYTAKMEPYKTSMMLDYEAGREMEIEAIVGDPLRVAHSQQISCGEIESIYRRLLQKRYHSPHVLNAPKVEAHLLIDRTEIRIRQYFLSRSRTDHFAKYWRPLFVRLREHVADETLTRKHWVGLSRIIADSIAPPEHGLYHELMALLTSAQGKVDRALKDDTWREN